MSFSLNREAHVLYELKDSSAIVSLLRVILNITNMFKVVEYYLNVLLHRKHDLYVYLNVEVT